MPGRRWGASPRASETAYREPNIAAMSVNDCCPLDYRYRPSDLRDAAPLVAHTAYVIGGLYGNRFALHEILRMRDAERVAGIDVTLVFNGDHNWFDIDADDFRAINTMVLEHAALRGNVETELGGAPGQGCGCNYPASVDAGVVDRSDRIMDVLRATAATMPDLVARLTALPRWLVLQVAGRRVGVVHGDAWSLAGWDFDAGRLALPELRPRIEAAFDEAGVCAFASTHTCLPRLQSFGRPGAARVVVNNGSAGMANFRGSRCGLITRISADRAVPANSLAGVDLGGLRIDALPVSFDDAAWIARFLQQWPAGSLAHLSYHDRIVDGPGFSPARAYGPHRVGAVSA
jgi:hypothetical protein